MPQSRFHNTDRAARPSSTTATLSHECRADSCAVRFRARRTSRDRHKQDRQHREACPARIPSSPWTCNRTGIQPWTAPLAPHGWISSKRMITATTAAAIANPPTVPSLHVRSADARINATRRATIAAAPGNDRPRLSHVWDRFHLRKPRARHRHHDKKYTKQPGQEVDNRTYARC